MTGPELRERTFQQVAMWGADHVVEHRPDGRYVLANRDGSDTTLTPERYRSRRAAVDALYRYLFAEGV